LLLGVAQLGIEAADVVEELAGQLAARRDDRIRWPELLEDAGGLAGADLLADPPGTRSHSTACSRQQAWLRSRARTRCRLAHTFSTTAWSSASTGRGAGDRSAATATDKASFGSFLLVSPACSSRTRAASFGGTSSTCSPAASSCWASRCPSPAAPSTAQAR